MASVVFQKRMLLNTLFLLTNPHLILGSAHALKAKWENQHQTLTMATSTPTAVHGLSRVPSDLRCLQLHSEPPTVPQQDSTWTAWRSRGPTTAPMLPEGLPDRACQWPRPQPPGWQDLEAGSPPSNHPDPLPCYSVLAHLLLCPRSRTTAGLLTIPRTSRLQEHRLPLPWLFWFDLNVAFYCSGNWRLLTEACPRHTH